MAAWNEARGRPLLAADAWQALFHVNPYREKDERRLELARVGALLLNELLANSRGLVERPMQIHFLADGSRVEPATLGGGESPPRSPKG